MNPSTPPPSGSNHELKEWLARARMGWQWVPQGLVIGQLDVDWLAARSPTGQFALVRYIRNQFQSFDLVTSRWQEVATYLAFSAGNSVRFYESLPRLWLTHPPVTAEQLEPGHRLEAVPGGFNLDWYEEGATRQAFFHSNFDAIRFSRYHRFSLAELRTGFLAPDGGPLATAAFA